MCCDPTQQYSTMIEWQQPGECRQKGKWDVDWDGDDISVIFIVMDPRLYIYELRRPRVSNPTFNSSHVNNTCFSIYSGGPLHHAPSPPAQQGQSISSSLNLPRIPSNDPPKDQPTRSRASSHLSNYGSSLLRVQDKDVYNKQRQRFNIISMQPVTSGETIKKYPKLTLEDKDAYYFRKMAQDQLHKQNTQHIQERTQTMHEQNIAGKHTYGIEGDKVPLNLWESYGSGTQKHAKFTPGMLNHVDQFRSLI